MKVILWKELQASFPSQTQVYLWGKGPNHWLQVTATCAKAFTTWVQQGERQPKPRGSCSDH